MPSDLRHETASGVGPPFYAHSDTSGPTARWQALEDHLVQVAGLAGGFAGGFGASDWGALAGLLHDLGKYSPGFQRRLRGGPKVDHSTAGAQEALARYGPQVGRTLAYLISGHHGGMLDGISGTEACLERRLRKRIEDYSAFPADLLPAADAAPEGLPFTLEPQRAGFQLAFFLRMLFSCLVDADYLDTEAVLDPDRAAWRGAGPDMFGLQQRLVTFLDTLRANAGRSHINGWRCEILEQCLAAAERNPGLFSLTVPTGGGKTISSLAFALAHCRRHGLDRVIYVIPYTSIIEQTAAVFRSILGPEAVVEHHSALGFESGEDDPSEALRRQRLASESWDAPLIVTTNVQFFESLFSNRPSRCRKLHRMAGSVVILDEAQMLPRELLRPCMEAIRELTTSYRASVMLCTATQPTLSRAETFRDSRLQPREMIADPQRLYQRFRRVAMRQEGSLDNQALAERLLEHQQVLCILNTRNDARSVFRALTALPGATGCFHLSALMYPEHRSRKLAQIRQALETREPCRVVSTQLVEAGVDLDFPVVYRALAGIDSLAQAAGRCNREGRLSQGDLHVFVPESGLPPRGMRPPAEEARAVLRNFEDPLSLEAVAVFFENLFWRQQAELDRKGILKALEQGVTELNIPFSTVADKFRYIDSPSEGIFVCPDMDRRQEIIDGLTHSPRPGRYLRMAQPYTVQVYPHEMYALDQAGAVCRVGECQIPVLEDMDRYHEDLGLLVEPLDRPGGQAVIA